MPDESIPYLTPAEFSAVLYALDFFEDIGGMAEMIDTFPTEANPAMDRLINAHAKLKKWHANTRARV